MLERMIAPLIDNLLAEYGLTRNDIVKLVSQGDDLAKQAREAINTIAAHVASIEQRQGEIAEGLAILLAKHNAEQRATLAALEIEQALALAKPSVVAHETMNGAVHQIQSTSGE